jgi:UDP-galactopyranose mutase
MKYDFLIVGAGIFGSVCARELTDAGHKCLIIDKRNHIAGNCYSKKHNKIDIHYYGAHIFHTSSKKIWEYVNRFAEFNNYRHHVLANYNGEIYSLPFNMWTFNRFWGVTKPEEAKKNPLLLLLVLINTGFIVFIFLQQCQPLPHNLFTIFAGIV